MSLLISIIAVGLLLSVPAQAQAQEDASNASFCSRMGVRHAYTYPAGKSSIRVDCETADTVYEGGLDNRRSLDSVQ